MAIRTPRGFFTYGDHNFSFSLHSPIQGTEDGEDSAGKILRAIINGLAKNATRIIPNIDYALELDGDAYSVHCTGTPVELALLDGSYSGYAIHIAIVPRPPVRDIKKNE